MIRNNRPMKYRRVFEVDAFRLDENNGSEVAKWCGGRYRTESGGSSADEVPIVQVPYFNSEKNIDIKTAYVGDYVLKLKDGTHDVWTKVKFAEEQLEPFYHRGRGVANDQSAD